MAGENRLALRGENRIKEFGGFPLSEEQGRKLIEVFYRGGKRIVETFVDKLDQKRKRRRTDTSRGTTSPSSTPYPMTNDMIPSNRKMKPAHGNVWTWCKYICNPNQIPIANSQLWNYSTAGQGPGLYWTRDYSTAGTLRLNKFVFASPYQMQALYGTMFTFVADWPFLNVSPTSDMNPFNASSQGPSWAYYLDNTVDPDSTVQLTDFIGTFGSPATANGDWSSITHLATHLDMNFTNFSLQDYIVEVLFFKSIPDPHLLTYDQLQMLPTSGETDLDSYCSENAKMFGTPQIRIVKKSRFRLPGINKMSNFAVYGSGAQAATNGNVMNRQNIKIKKFRLRHRYVMNKGIMPSTTQMNLLNETTFYENLYRVETGTFCRIFAWPETAYVVYGTGVLDEMPRAYPVDQAAVPASVASPVQALYPQIRVDISKKSFLKVDCPMLKGPFRTD